MKKLLFTLVLLLAVLCAGTALATSHPCDECGGPTTMLSSGSWCHWYCESCDYTTSRNHDPNSAYSGLVPDSCSGTCSWCGAAANDASHSFTTYTLNGDATCTEDGTETSKCANVQCSATHTRDAVGSALGHQFTTYTSAPKCEMYGATVYTCEICGYSEYRDYVEPLGHNFVEWTYNGDGTHTGACSREGCNKTTAAHCTMTEVTVGGVTISYCSVCLHLTSAESTTAPVCINGLMVLVDAVPLDVELELDDLLYMIIVGSAEELTGKVELIIDLKEYPFQTEGKYAGVLPEQLEQEKLDLFYVGLDVNLNEETWTPAQFTLEDGVLTFQTETLGVYLIKPVQEKVPSPSLPA